MTVVVTCKKCGAENRLGLLFCISCGAKLDVSDESVQSAFRKAARKVSIFYPPRLIRLVVTVTLMVLLGLLLWPAASEADVGDRKQAVQLKVRLEQLNLAVVDNSPMKLSVTEAELNSYLAARLEATRGEVSGLTFDLRDIRINLETDHVTVWYGGHLGPVPLTYEAVGKTALEDGVFTFNAASVRIGHLPMPGPAGRWVRRQMGDVFSGMEERLMLNRMGSVTIGNGAMRATTVQADQS